MPKITYNPRKGTDEILDRKGVAAALKVGTGTITRMMEEGLPYLIVGSRPRFYYPDVIRWLHENRSVAREQLYQMS